VNISSLKRISRNSLWMKWNKSAFFWLIFLSYGKLKLIFNDTFNNKIDWLNKN
jgi:hypothetical protein